LILIQKNGHLIDKKNDAWNRRNHKPTCVEAEPSEVETHLFSIIVCDEVKGLHMVLVITSNKAEK
jgi:hypothetical protein